MHWLLQYMYHDFWTIRHSFFPSNFTPVPCTVVVSSTLSVTKTCLVCYSKDWSYGHVTETTYLGVHLTELTNLLITETGIQMITGHTVNLMQYSIIFKIAKLKAKFMLNITAFEQVLNMLTASVLTSPVLLDKSCTWELNWPNFIFFHHVVQGQYVLCCLSPVNATM